MRQRWQLCDGSGNRSDNTLCCGGSGGVCSGSCGGDGVSRGEAGDGCCVSGGRSSRGSSRGSKVAVQAVSTAVAVAAIAAAAVAAAAMAAAAAVASASGAAAAVEVE